MHNTLYQRIDSTVDRLIKTDVTGPTGIYIEGGHFDPRYGVTEFSTQSLKDSVFLVEKLIQNYKKDIRVVLGILVDDLGLQCGSEACSIGDLQNNQIIQNHNIPLDLQEILVSKYIKKDKVKIFSERSSKNRGIKNLKNLIEEHTDFIYLEHTDNKQSIYFTDENGLNILIGEINGENWVAKCPTIMAQHYTDAFDLLQKRFPEITNKKIIIDFSETIDKNKVEKGSELGLCCFYKENICAEIYNVFYNTPDGNFFTTSHFIKEDYV